MKPVPVRPIHRLGLPLGLGLGLVFAVLFMAARLQTAAAQPGTALPAAALADSHPPLRTNTSGPLSSPSDTGASTFAAQAATETLWGEAVDCSLGPVVSPTLSTDKDFNDQAGWCVNFTGTATWTYTSIEDTSISSIKAVTLNVRLVISGTHNDRIEVSVYNGTGWQALTPIIASSPSTYTTFSFPATSLFAGPNQINAARVELKNLETQQGGPDTYDLYVDEVNLVVEANRPPIADDDSGSTNEDIQATGTISASDPDGDPLSYGITTQPAYGSASINGSGGWTYVPANRVSDYMVTFIVTVTDTGNLTDTATVMVSVTANNDPPTLDAISDRTINEDAGLQTVNLSGITSGDADETQALIVTAASTNTSLIPHPSVTYTSPDTTGSLSFTPVPDQFGTATVVVTVTDGLSNTVRTFLVTVNAVNDPPTLDPISDRTINEDAGLQTVNLSGITSGAANETQVLTVTAASANTGLIPTPVVTYTSPDTTGSLGFTPVANQFGAAMVVVTVTDGLSDTFRTFLVTVTNAPDPPVAVDDNYATPEDVTLTRLAATGVLSNDTDIDGDTLTATLGSDVSQGVLNLRLDGSFVYTPNLNYYGTDNFTYIASDGGLTDMATVTITVTPVNDAPVAEDDAYSIARNRTLQVAEPGVLGNDSDLENDALTAVLVEKGSLNLTLNPRGSFVYTPALNFTGLVTFTYKANDTISDSNVAVVTITVKSFCEVTQVTTTSGVVTNTWPSISGGSQGLRIAFVSNGDGNQEIFVYDRPTGAVEQVTHTPLTVTNERPSISGNGKYIAFSSDASTLAGNPDPNREIFRYDISGGNYVLATNTDGSVVPGFFSHLDSSISYTGTRIAFSSEYDFSGTNTDNNLEIFWYDSRHPPFSQVSAGYGHTCGLREDGSLACWGAGTSATGAWPHFGQAAPPSGGFGQVSAGLYHTCGVRPNGSVACWGWNDNGQAVPPSDSLSQVSAGWYHTCGVKAGGSVACSGADWYGQAPSSRPGPFSQVSAGLYHTCGLRTDNNVECWGADWYGQAPLLRLGPFSQVSAGSYNTCGVRADNSSVECWGANWYGQAPLSLPGPFSQVSAGSYHTCGLRADGNVECWGANWYGQAPLSLPGPFSQVSAGLYHTCGVRTNGSVECWGWNDYAQSSPPSVSLIDPISQLSNSTLSLGSWEPSLSGDGQTVAFVSGTPGDTEIFVYNSATGVSQVTTTGSGVTNDQPSISYDGQTIAFVSDRDGNPEIYVYNGITTTQVTSTTSEFFSVQPAISGDGKRIAFVSNGQHDPRSENTDFNQEVFLALLGGTSTITFEQVTATPIAVTNEHPSLNRWGDAIAFGSDGDLDGENAGENPEIFLALCEADLPDVALEVKKYPSPQAYQGNWFPYRIVITNTDATQTAFDLVINDTLQGQDSQLATAQPGCSNTSSTAATCYFDELAPSSSQTIFIWARRTSEGLITNTVEAIAANPNSSDSDTIFTYVGPAADLSVQKEVSPTSATVGEPLTYTVTIENGGPLWANMVTLTDTLEADAPVTMTLVSANAPEGPLVICDPVVGNTVTVTEATVSCVWNGSLGPSQRISFTIVVVPSAGGVITNTAVVASSSPDDPFVTNNETDPLVVRSRGSGVFLPIILKNE